MVLRRRVGTGSTFAEVAVRGYATGFRPDQLAGNVMQGDQRFTVGPDTGALGAPRANDRVRDEGRDWTVLGADAIRVGERLCGYVLHARGG
jgi:hypothetical protein